jgi:cytochrome c
VIWLLLLTLASPATQTPPDPGARAFQRCAACHSIRADDQDSPAPSLRGVVGRRAGSLADFPYSDAMTAAGRRGMVWDEATLARFLADPDAVVPGTDMPFQGGSATERAAVIAWLRRQR